PVAKAGGKFSRLRHPRATVGGVPVIFDPDSEYAIESRLKAVAKRLQQQLANPPAKPPRKRKQQRKPAQEEILRKVREKYPPNGEVGDASTAKVRRTISGKGFNPGWDSVHRALGRADKK